MGSSKVFSSKADYYAILPDFDWGGKGAFWVDSYNDFLGKLVDEMRWKPIVLMVPFQYKNPDGTGGIRYVRICPEDFVPLSYDLSAVRLSEFLDALAEMKDHVPEVRALILTSTDGKVHGRVHPKGGILGNTCIVSFNPSVVPDDMILPCYSEPPDVMDALKTVGDGEFVGEWIDWICEGGRGRSTLGYLAAPKPPVPIPVVIPVVTDSDPAHRRFYLERYVRYLDGRDIEFMPCYDEAEGKVEMVSGDASQMMGDAHCSFTDEMCYEAFKDRIESLLDFRRINTHALFLVDRWDDETSKIVSKYGLEPIIVCFSPVRDKGSEVYSCNIPVQQILDRHSSDPSRVSRSKRLSD